MIDVEELHEPGTVKVVAGMCTVLIALLLAFGVMIRANEITARQGLSQRFVTRAALTGSFAASFIEDLAAREQTQAGRLLAAENVSKASFDGVVKSFGFKAAVLLDSDGRLLHGWPVSTKLVGRDMTVDYLHLRDAVNGKVGVSEMVASAARGLPITAVAVPIGVAGERRVFSGAFSPETTPLGTYLDSVVPISGGAAYLVDSSGDILGQGGDRVARQPFTQLPESGTTFELSPVLTAAVADVPNAPWRVVLVAPTRALYAPAAAHSAAWLLWIAVALAGGLSILLFVRLGRERRLADATARSDSMTGLPNRRSAQESLLTLAAMAERHHTPLSALMIDIDRFKRVNDTHGHAAGDVVIAAVAEVLRRSLRAGDVAARWGGEEFLVLLPHTDLAAAGVVANRIRASVSGAVTANRGGGDVVTVSIGAGDLQAGDSSAMVLRADAWMYVAKANGRDRVEGVPLVAALLPDMREPVATVRA